MSTDGAPQWRGLNHLALITPDMEATVRFYHGVLGARLVATVGTADFRHYFFDFGPGNTIAFFEYRQQEPEPLAKKAGVPDPRAPQFDHLSLNVADAGALDALRNRLKEHGIEVTDVVDHGFIRSIYFTDPHGIALEASYWVHDATGVEVVDVHDDRFFGDPDPVPAVAEIAAGGGPRWSGTTSLS